jgi:hypothetical protein
MLLLSFQKPMSFLKASMSNTAARCGVVTVDVTLEGEELGGNSR